MSNTIHDQTTTIDQYWSGTLASTPIGPVSVLVSTLGLAVVEFASAQEFARSLVVSVENNHAPDLLEISLRQIDEYLTGKRQEFTMPIDLRGLSEFTQRILYTTMLIPYGKVRTYGSLAAAAGHPGAARAVGGVMSRNPIPLVIPCHRVVASNGALHGYSAPGGLKTKSVLLEMEDLHMQNFRLSGNTWKS